MQLAALARSAPLRLATSLPALVLGMVFPPILSRHQVPKPPASPSRWILVYAGGRGRPQYSVGDLIHLIAAVDTLDRPEGWLCDAALFLEPQAVSGRYYVRSVAGQPADGNDWNVYLDSIFAPTGAIERLDSAVGLLSKPLGSVRGGFQIAVMIPYPDPKAGLVRLGGADHDLSRPDGRIAAVRAYLDDVLRRYRERAYRNVTLTAFYWVNEGLVDLPDTAWINKIAVEVHRRDRRFLWIPAYGNQGVPLWHKMGFDDAWLQPNFFFHPEVPQTRFDSALATARTLGMGIELEFDRRMFQATPFTDRLLPYLAALEAAPDMRARSIAIYEGAGALLQLARSRDEWHRALYHRLVQTLTATDAGSPRQ